MRYILSFLIFTAQAAQAAKQCSDYLSSVESLRAKALDFFIIQEQMGYGQGYPFSSRQEHILLAKEAWKTYIDAITITKHTKNGPRNLEMFLEKVYFGKTLVEIAKDYNLTPVRVGNIISKLEDNFKYSRSPNYYTRREDDKAAKKLLDFLNYERGNLKSLPD